MAPAKTKRQKLPAIVAHRGASATYPENTLLSFQGAIDAGADIIELDVRLTADQVAVVLHDPDVSATTDGTGFVHTLTLEEVKRLDATAGKGPRTEIPTLLEALQLLSGRAGIDIEIKNLPGEPAFDSPREALAERVVSLVEEMGFEGPVLASSFNWLSIERIRELSPTFRTGFLTTAGIDPWASLVYARSKGHDYVLPQAPALLLAGAEFVQEAHREGILVGTWTVDDPVALELLFEMGVDAVATNVPEIAVPIRDRFAGD
jgi:glycerophosphoryl diester phosphodiesterase